MFVIQSGSRRSRLWSMGDREFQRCCLYCVSSYRPCTCDCLG